MLVSEVHFCKTVVLCFSFLPDVLVSAIHVAHKERERSKQVDVDLGCNVGGTYVLLLLVA
jgi:hypothetical protein